MRSYSFWRSSVMLLAALSAAGCAKRMPSPYAGLKPNPYANTAAYQTSGPYQPVAAAQVRAPAYTGSVAYTGSTAAYSAHAAYGANAAYGPAAVPVTFESPYTLDAGDRLRISVFGQEGLTNSYPVDATGAIMVPLIGSTPVRGFTTEDVSQVIAERLRQGFIREPQVTVQIEQYRPFFILGEVTTPGQYAYVANMSAQTAIAIAGGFGPRASKGTVDISRTIAGQTVRASVPLTYQIRPGDTLNIKERWF
jgi:polysaccharide export outer membrane protein